MDEWELFFGLQKLCFYARAEERTNFMAVVAAVAAIKQTFLNYRNIELCLLLFFWGLSACSTLLLAFLFLSSAFPFLLFPFVSVKKILFALFMMLFLVFSEIKMPLWSGPY